MENKIKILYTILIAWTVFLLGLLIAFLKQSKPINYYIQSVEHIDRVENLNIENLNPISIPTEKIEPPKIIYTVEEFKFIDLKVNNWVLKEEYQKILWNLCKEFDINFYYALATVYKENSRNVVDKISNLNSNGSFDIGIMQFNSYNTDILLKIGKTENLEKLFDPYINIKCGIYLIHRNLNYYDVNSLYELAVMYNGGYVAVKNIRSGKWSEECSASKYAKDVLNIMETLKEYVEINYEK